MTPRGVTLVWFNMGIRWTRLGRFQDVSRYYAYFQVDIGLSMQCSCIGYACALFYKHTKSINWGVLWDCIIGLHYSSVTTKSIVEQQKQLPKITLFTNFSEMRRLFESVFLQPSNKNCSTKRYILKLKCNLRYYYQTPQSSLKCAKECTILTYNYISRILGDTIRKYVII